MPFAEVELTGESYLLRQNSIALMQVTKRQKQGWASFTEGRRNIFAEPVLKEIGASHGKSSGQVALRYLVQNGIGAIPKSMRKERMKENINIFDFVLTEEECKKIEKMNEGRSLFGWY